MTQNLTFGAVNTVPRNSGASLCYALLFSLPFTGGDRIWSPNMISPPVIMQLPMKKYTAEYPPVTSTSTPATQRGVRATLRHSAHMQHGRGKGKANTPALSTHATRKG